MTIRVGGAVALLLCATGAGVGLHDGLAVGRHPAGQVEAGPPTGATPGTAASPQPQIDAAGRHASLLVRPQSIAPAPPERAPASGLGPFRRAWVAVPVATVWNHPGTARPVDQPAVSAAPDVSRWVTTMAYQQKLGLDDLLATQALLYQPLFEYGHDGKWAHVIVLGQTGSVYPWGIAGWVPEGQITYTPPPAVSVHETVDVPMLAVGGIELSYGTDLPVAASTGDHMTVVLPKGRFSVPSSSLRLTSPRPSGSAVVAQAERFLGLPYLWAGTSSFGYDCSGLTYSVYRRFGITLARDAGDQAKEGTPAQRTDLRAGDLVFFAFDGTVDHVGIYAGNGMMVDSPRTGAAVEVVPLWSPGLTPYYAGARRYI